MFGLHRRIARRRDGRFDLRLPDAERALLRELPAQLRSLMFEGDSSLARLFPPAYPDDPERDAEYHRLMDEDLRARHLAALDVVERTVDASVVDMEELLGWLAALNDLRLVLGTRLDVTEEVHELPEDDPDAGAFAVYSYLGWLQEQVVAALDPEYDT